VMVLPVCVTPDRNFGAGFTQMQPLSIDIQVPGIVFNDPAFNAADITYRSWRGGQIPLDRHDPSGWLRGLLGLPESSLSMLAFQETMYHSSSGDGLARSGIRSNETCSSRLSIIDKIFSHAD
jgi:hypothetical protein